MPTAPESILGLDVGDQRVGLAATSLAARLPKPLTTLKRDDTFFDALQRIIEAENVTTLVVGWPRNLSGDSTEQTRRTEDFTGELRRRYKLPVHRQDEAVTSRQAEAELRARGKAYARGDIDALAATYILEDFLAGRQEADR